MMRYFIAVCSLAILITAISCSTNGTSPISPNSTPLKLSKTTETISDNVLLWGYWDIYIDTENKTIESVPIRGAEFAANVVRFIDGPPLNLILQLGTIDVQPEYMDIPVDVGLRHPFAGLDVYTGFDVIGVFMGNGSSSHPAGFTIQGSDDQQLLNPDGFTRWFNAPEFSGAGNQMALLGYTPGKLGTKDYVPTAELNPYKYFTDSLGKDDDPYLFLSANASERGVFRPGSVNHRQYDIRFPNSTGVKFQYAVVARWEPNVNSPNPPTSLDDFPPEANADEALVINVVDNSDAYYIDNSTFGGSVKLDISPIDWSAVASGVMEEYQIFLYSDAWTGAFPVDMTPISSGENYYTFSADAPVETLSGLEPIGVWIEINYPNHTYENNFGVTNNADGALASYFYTEVPVDSEIPQYIVVTSPNGGEELVAGACWEITWNSLNVTNVDIAYSKDNFVSNIVPIASNVPSTGSYDWAVIPNDLSTTVRIRITDSAYPSVSDKSNSDFTIRGPLGWVKVWGGSGNDIAYSVKRDSSGNMYVTGFYFGAQDFDPSGNTDNKPGFGSWDSYVSKFDSNGNYIWGKAWGATGYADSARDVAIDSNGNVYIVGWWQNNQTPPQIDLDPGPGQDWFYGTVGDNGYLVKLNSSGNYVWGRSWNGGDWDWWDNYGVCVDNAGDVYVTGKWQSYNAGSADFDPTSGTDMKTSNQFDDAFLIKLGSDGSYKWGLTWGAQYWDCGNDLFFYDSSNILVTGFFSGSNVDLDPTGGTSYHSSSGSTDRNAFLISITPSGTFNYAKSWGGTSNDEGRRLAKDSSGNLFITGNFGATADLNPGAGVNNFTSNGATDAFLIKLDSSTNYLWAKSWGGTDEDNGMGIAADSSGNAIVTGYFMTTVDFDPSNPGIWEFDALFTHDAYVMKLDSSGNVSWVRVFGGEETPGYWDSFDHAHGVVTDSSNNIFVTGQYNSKVDFWPLCGVDYRTAGGISNDPYLWKLLPNGLW